MKLKTLVLIAALLSLFSAPSWASSFGVFGSFWNTTDADDSWGGGVRAGFDLTKKLELEFHGTYYPDFKTDQFPGVTIDITAIPIDMGLKYDFMPDKGVNPYLGAGITYYFLSTDPGSIDDQLGAYLDGGLDFGGADGPRFFTEVMWRIVDTALNFGTFDEDVSFDGVTLNAGLTWRWGN